MNIGLQELEKQLQNLGFTTERLENMVAFPFKIPHGRFKGMEVHVALQGPQFPNIPPSGPYVKPHLLPHQPGGVHPTGGIHNRNKPNREWQYWSRPFTGWETTDKSIRTYLAFIRTIFDFS